MKNLKTFVVICAMMMSTSAVAADEKWYGSASGGLLKISVACNNLSSCEDSGWALQSKLGYYLTDNISLDLGVIAGRVEVHNNITYNVRNIGLGTTLYWPLGDQFSLYGKVGYHFWEEEDEISGDGFYANPRETDGTDPYVGLGAEFLFGQSLGVYENLGLRAEYIRNFVRGELDNSLDTATIGIVFHW